MVYYATWYILFHTLYNTMEEEVKVVEAEAVEEVAPVEEAVAEEPTIEEVAEESAE